MAFSRRAAHGDAGLQAACRVYAAEVAGRLAASAVRIASAAGVPDAAVATLREAMGHERLVTARAGSFKDMEAVVEWLLAEPWPR
jgi:hypothetical protein